MAGWNTSDIPSQVGRTVLVTGTGGIGFHVSKALAHAGATVIVAGRNAAKGAAAIAQISRSLPRARVRFGAVDLASLESIETFAETLLRSHGSLDLLVNNAAVMTPPQRKETADGFELQMGTNHLGHFALTARLLPLLREGRSARVVSLSSIAARSGVIDFDDLQSYRRYVPMTAYSQSKLACLLFAFELQRRSAREGWGIQSVAAHPGIARTDLLPNGAGPSSPQALARRYLWFLFQPAERGALPPLYAATAPTAQAGGYYGPDRLGETRGRPTAASVPAQAEDLGVAERLWQVSEGLTGGRFGGRKAQGA
ncbi:MULTISPECIES: SDR family oxidoreductase [unclassified Pseudoxanthomonas]|uniref:SDR family oxidoreductase n=1 Tax=unclassified Pseudoxanthomonas TaxID=2645906 RepID=UPI0008F290D3|nr:MULTISPECIES: SDR family oxidoreductase [unclassified Pseudoxanthomonas]PPJ43867.1 short chain dehydrogenase [Pseudoxanthomonas sp. KAs_5_3]SFV36427.1 NADP-dependent 3-hydroxy acid dehydrogenase YdfG [Pseudoxanthomonas sp. YR558]